MTPVIIPGDVKNLGFGDGSRRPTVPQIPTHPANFPVIQIVTPKGTLGQRYINLADFEDIYGNVHDVDSPYYNAVSALLQMLAAAGQASIGVRRLTANQEKARWIHGIKVTRGPVVQYKRDSNGQFMLDPKTGQRIVDDAATPVDAGLSFEHVLMEANGQVFGKVATIDVDDGTDNGKATIYPLQEMETDIGDFYNRSGLTAGIPLSQDFSTVERFVRQHGVYPFQMRLYEKTESGTPVFVKTINNTDAVTYTLFDLKDKRTGVRYGLDQALGAYTGKTLNRSMIPRPAPFANTFVYKDNLELITREMFKVEKEFGDANGLIYLDNVPGNRQMNPLTCTNHEGIPYYAIECKGPTRLFNLNSAMDAKGGVSPFLTADLKTPVKVEGTYNFDPEKGQVDQLSTKDAWLVSQELILSDMMAYRKSLEMNDWVRNRQSIIFDCGYNDDIKNEMIQMLNARKDQVAIFQASYWLEDNTIEERYSIANSLSTRLRLLPESEKHGTPACRATICMWDAKIINEESGLDFPVVLDLAHKFAVYGGNAQGILRAEKSPDHGDNRKLTMMHTPTIDLEDDINASNNFQIGATTLRPYDTSNMLYRPALPSIYAYDDSVLKDFVTNFNGICAEKVIADTWPLVSGDTTLTEEDYAATVKDRSEEEIRNRFGSVIQGVLVRTYYDENQPSGRSVLRATGYVQFNKGKYMMEMDMIALNAADGPISEE